ncbi:MAG: nucleoside hydrolase, partial [Planctomycetota bacterium]
TVCRHWPTEMIWSGFAVGQKVIAGGGLVDTTTRNPVRRAYQLRMFDGRPSLRGGKPAFDQTAVLIAVRGVEDRYWRASPPGRVEVDDAGRTSWTAEEDGPHRFVNFRYRPAGVTALIDRMMAKPPLLKSQRPVPVIFDTDMGADIDDALALAVLHGLQSRGEVDMLAITSSKDHPASATVIDMINTWYGRGDIPIGRVVDGFQQDDGKYLIPTASAKTADGQPLFPHDLTPESAAPEAVSLIRKTLANADDDSVVLILVGQQTNVARLLQSAPDQHSNLSGMDLVKQKVRCLSVMAGAFNRPDQGPVRFDGKPEWNIRVDVESAKTVFEKWPVEIVVAPWELGRRLMYPGFSVERDFDRPNRPPHPVAHTYRHWDRMPYDRPSFDLISVLHAARPNRGYFNETEWGRVVLDEKGYTTFKPDPGGKVRVLDCTDAQAARTIEAFVGLASEAP